MTITIDTLAGEVGYPLRVLEELAAELPGGDPQFFRIWAHRKRRGGIREIVSPKPLLDSVNKNLYRSFLQLFPYSVPDHVHGFVPRRSIVTNASAHLDKECVLRVDLEDFFPSIRSAAIKAALQLQGCDEKATELIARLVTIYDKLPIGLSTSPYLSNIVFQKTDESLSEYATLNNLSFTRYVDDLVFSGEISDGNFEDISRILNDAGWSINVNKTAFMRRGGPQYVTGLYVGMADRPRVPRALKREMRRILFLIQKFGYETYMEELGGESANMFPQRLRGWSCYIASVERDLGFSLLRAIEDSVPTHYISERDLAAYLESGGGIEVIENIEDIRNYHDPEP